MINISVNFPVLDVKINFILPDKSGVEFKIDFLINQQSLPIFRSIDQ